MSDNGSHVRLVPSVSAERAHGVINEIREDGSIVSRLVATSEPHPAGSKAVDVRAMCDAIISDISRARMEIPEDSPLGQIAKCLQRLASQVWLIAGEPS